MQSKRGFWRALGRLAASPRVDEEDLERRLKEARLSLPVPVFWLLGKAQSGKTSLVRALTGSSRAEIGGGFRPCTRTAQLYSFPSEEDCFLRFLDTR
ncbi:MAG: GTPase domain-containing protein, partial [Planctomycetota bacterium]